MFRFEEASSPDLLDAKGRQFMLPTLRPAGNESAEQRNKDESNNDRELLRAMMDNPDGTQAEWGNTIRRAKGRVNAKLQKLKHLKLVEQGLGKWRVTPKGLKEVGELK